MASSQKLPLGTTRKLPYEGIRVLEFTHVWAGPLCGQLLADGGADVVKLESHSHIDVHRRAGPYARGVPDLDSSGVWNAQNRGKRSIALNLKEPQGVEIALELVSVADVVIDNFRPGVLRGLGLSQETMKSKQPRLVGVSVSGFGLDEKWRNYPAYGPTMDAIAGLSMATADAAGRPQAVNGWLPDVSASLFATIAIASALSAVGDEVSRPWIDIDELLSTLALLPEQAEMEVRKKNADRTHEIIMSNRFPGGDCCLTLACHGDDEWVAVRLPETFDDSWILGLRVLNDLSITRQNEKSDSVALALNIDDALVSLSASTSVLDKSDVAQALQQAGIEAAPVNAAPDLLNDEELNRRNSYVVQNLSNGHELKSYGSVIRWNAEKRINRVAPQFGEHTVEVLEEWLKYSPEHIETLDKLEKLFW